MLDKNSNLPYLPNLLLISGNGRNSGKTTLATAIIDKFSKKHSIIGLKICPHFHPLDPDSKILIKEKSFTIIEEKFVFSEKDSYRMLASGADKVYYIQTIDNNLQFAFNAFHGLIEPDTLIVCESGGLRNFIIPGLFLIVNPVEKKVYKTNIQSLIAKANRIILFDGLKFDLDINEIKIIDKSWELFM